MENAEKGFFNLVLGEPAGKVLGLTNVELATRLADKDVDSEHKKEEIGSPSRSVDRTRDRVFRMVFAL